MYFSRNLLLLLFALMLPGRLILAQDVQRNQVFNEHIKSVQLFPKNNELGGPFIDLLAQQLELHFDDLTTQVKDYQYTLIHCNANWTPSDLLSPEYIEGFSEDYITSYAASFNTRTAYVHYNLEFPGRNMRLKKSGNYVIRVFETGNSESPVLQLRFVVYENKSTIGARIKRSDIVKEREHLQEVDVNVRPGFAVVNPFTEIKLTLLQNGRWDNAVENLPPMFIRENEVLFDYDTKSSFPAGNEYRYVDLKSLRFQSERVKKIRTVDNSIFVDLVPDMVRSHLPYSTYSDINGRYVIRNDDGPNNPLTDADYAWVKFSLPYEDPIPFGTLHIGGDLTQQQFNAASQLKYNYETKAYEMDMLLKQGYYSYQYFLLRDGEKPDITFTEGAFFQTENVYTVLVYYRDFSSDYDRVIGFEQVKSTWGY